MVAKVDLAKIPLSTLMCLEIGANVGRKEREARGETPSGRRNVATNDLHPIGAREAAGHAGLPAAGTTAARLQPGS
jgi:hypothetical protein